jgi:formylglycine-generating enzyme required for sulfatase activity
VCTARARGSELVPETVVIPAGGFVTGSDRAEREAAYRLDESAYGHSATREQRWYENERDRQLDSTSAFEITRTPITNEQYAAFIADTGHPWPDVDEATWNGYGLVHPYSRTRRHAWTKRGPPAGRARHPVVLVSYRDAELYAAWLSRKTARQWRLPSESEWEKAVRGPDGRRFPWGNVFDPDRLNSHDRGDFDTSAVGAYPTGIGPYGLLDGAGQVFEWIRKPPGAQRAWVKGGSWDDKGCGVCRPAARHARPVAIKHLLIGFRLVVTIP